MPKLFIGNKNYSSWSMRPWLVLRWAAIPFDEVVIPLGGEGYGRGSIPAIRAVSPTGRVPALHTDGGQVVTDSLAITMWAADQSPRVWPADPAARAHAFSAAAEMHSSFAGLRRDLSMNLRRRAEVDRSALPNDTRADLDRVEALVGGLLSAHGGPWLCGERSAADAFYAPVATRLRTYGVPTTAAMHRWMEQLFADADVQAWEKAALHEPWSIGSTDALFGG